MTVILLAALAMTSQDLKSNFVNPPDSARPCVYWYFMEGNMTREGMTADLEDMKRVGLGGGIFLEVNIGIPRGPVQYMSPEWLSMVGHAVKEADRLGLEIRMGTGPGWCGTGGSWVPPDQAMQHLVASETKVTGPQSFSGHLPQPKPHQPFFGLGSLTPELHKLWTDFYKDEAVIAVPAPKGDATISDLVGKSLVYRAPYSSQPNVPPFLYPDRRQVAPSETIPASQIIDLTSKLSPDGSLNWQVPAGDWIILRFGRALTGQTSRPAPDSAMGFETDKFDEDGINAHLDHFIDAIVKETGPNRVHGQGLASLHFDSWEMGSQNWSAHFRAEFTKRRGYDPLRFLPVMAGKIVDSVDVSERFLWDLRLTGQELVLEHHIAPIKKRAEKYGLDLSIEPYDMNPTMDLVLGGPATMPMGEFWSEGKGYRSEYSVFEAVSVGHTCGKPIIGAESFTANEDDKWLQHPASMKAQGDWALAAGINKIYFHRYQHQPKPDVFPGMTMGPYGVHWERTETWWDMVDAYHRYLSRCQYALRQGLPVADVLYLMPEGAPNVFQVPNGATVGDLPDRRGFNFDACSPDRLLEAATVKDGRIVFPDGMSYRMLVLPRVDAMTPRLAGKIEELVRSGLTVVGAPAKQSPSLVGFPDCDHQLQAIEERLFGEGDSKSVRQLGKGRVVRDQVTQVQPVSLDDAKWIWTDEGDPSRSAPVGERTFEANVSLPKDVAHATATFTADNSFRLSVNGHQVLHGSDFHHLEQAEVGKLLHRGLNQLVVLAVNEGTSPNPAGLLGSIEVTYHDGTKERFNTGESWHASDGHGVTVIGGWATGPWNLDRNALPKPAMYPDYEFTSQVLREQLKIVPDLESHDALRYSHRRLANTDLYFVANRSDKEYRGEATFRVASGQPEWWDPMTGISRPLPGFSQSHGVTTIDFRLSGHQSGFVVFTPAAHKAQRVAQNFPVSTPVLTITGTWTVSFEPRFGGPASAEFPKLMDWKDRPEDSIRYYSGKAVYRKSFDFPSVKQGVFQLSLGDVHNIASVRLNGKDLGVAWCAPWQVNIPSGLLRAKDNQLEITVANLWGNRLIGDSKLPSEKRVTQTTWTTYRPDSPLQPSGLLGPVKILREGENFD